MNLENFIYKQYKEGINLIDFKEPFKNDVEELFIPNEWNVVAIAKLSFYDTEPFSRCAKLKKVVLPDTLKELNEAFCDCNSLEEVIFPNTLKKLGNSNFRNCKNFKEVNLPTTLTRIGYGNFKDSPVYVSQLDDNGDGCVYIGNYLINCEYNHFNTFEIKKGTILIADCACSSKRFSEIILPDGLKYIGTQAFYYCNYMKKPVLPNSILWIGEEAFKSSNGDLIEGCFVTDATINEKGWLVYEKELGYISPSKLQEVAKKLDGYLLKINYTNDTSYDNSDDDRVEDSSSSYSSIYYKKFDVVKNSKSLLRINGEIVGVVFRVTSGRDEPRLYGFTFDNSIKQSMTLGYSASHSSYYITITSVTLVKKGENGAPDEGYFVNFEPSSTSTSI